MNISLLKIRWMLPILLLFYIHSYSQCTLGEYINLKYYPKAKGVNMKIRVPIGWKVREGNRPNIVKKFMMNDLVGYSIMVRNLPTFISRNEVIENLQSEETIIDELKNLMGSDVKYKLIGKPSLVFVDKYPSILYKCEMKSNKLGKILIGRMKWIIIFYEDKIVSITLSLNWNCQNCSQKFPIYDENLLEQCFLNITNSIVFPEQYKYSSYE